MSCISETSERNFSPMNGIPENTVCFTRLSQAAFSCSKLTIETLGQGVKCVQSLQ